LIIFSFNILKLLQPAFAGTSKFLVILDTIFFKMAAKRILDLEDDSNHTELTELSIFPLCKEHQLCILWINFLLWEN